MASTSRIRRESRLRRHRRVRKKIRGTSERPRLAIHRSNKHISLQVIDDESGHTLAAASSVEAAMRNENGATVESAKKLGGPFKGRFNQKCHLLFPWLYDLVTSDRILDAVEDITPNWQTDMKPENFMRYANHPNALSIESLRQYAGPESVGSRPGYFYDTWLHQKIAGPIMLAIMPLLGAIAAFAHHRQGAAVLTIIYGVSLGFLFVVIDNILLAMGQFGSLPPLLAAWLPLAFFTTVGIWIVFRFEHSGART